MNRAVFAGYRPCQRCRPLESDGRPPEWVERLLAMVDADPERRIRAADLRAMGLTPERVRRYFQRSYGMTFDAYCRARRLGGALEQLREGADLDSAAFDAGYESLSGFREAFSPPLRRAPGRGARAEFIRVAWLRTPHRPDGRRGHRRGAVPARVHRPADARTPALDPGQALQAPPRSRGQRAPRQTKDELDRYFAGDAAGVHGAAQVVGSDFQQRVWKALRRIPYGETRSYKQLAKTVRSPDAVRAVGQANGMNRIAIVIPCHRVVNADGRLGGYGGGLWRKQRLLALEQGQARLD